MPNYRRTNAKGGTFFFTVALADRSSDLLVKEIGRLRHIYRLPGNDRDYATRWSLIKSGFSRGLNAQPRSRSKVFKREKGIWQRRYWEHAIRDDADLERHVDYIHFNPVKHRHVTRVVDWPHSSFHRFVERGLLDVDWGGDVRNMDGLFGECRVGTLRFCPPYMEFARNDDVSTGGKQSPLTSSSSRTCLPETPPALRRAPGAGRRAG